MFRKKIFSDVTINFISSIMVMISIQVFLFPKVSRISDPEFFGTFVFLMSIFNFLSSAIGSAGTSVFLKKYNNFKHNNKVADGYREILKIIYFFLFLSFLILIIYFIQFDYSFFNQVLFVILTSLLTLRVYLVGWFRVELRYIELFKLNFILSIAYFLIFLFLSHVELIFLFIVTAELIYIGTALYIEKKPYILFPSTNSSKYLYKGFILLLFSSLLVSGLKYIDRWFINIYLNPELLAFFYVAAITGKLFSIPFNTLSSVIFSYYVQYESLNKKVINYLLIILPVIPLFLIIVGVIVGPIIISLLYPDYYNDSIKLFYILNIGYSVLIIDYLLRGFIVKFYKEKHKFFIDLISLVFCIFMLILLSQHFLLEGVAWALTLTFVFKSLIDYIYLMAYKFKG